MLLLSLIPTYLLITWSFKNGLQYRWERWSISFPLRWSNYAAAWEIVGDYMINTIIVAIIGLMGMLLLSLIGGYVFARMDFPFRQTLYYAIIALLMVPWVLSFIPAYMVYVRFGLLNSRWALIIPELAGGPIFGIFLMRAFISGIPEELFESAVVTALASSTSSAVSPCRCHCPGSPPWPSSTSSASGTPSSGRW